MVVIVLIALATITDRELDDRALAHRIRRGDRQAFRDFFERYHGRLFGFLRGRNLSEDECEDIIQEAFVAIWEKREAIDEGRSIRAFLFKIGYHRALNRIRDTARFVGVDGLNHVSPSADPERHAEHRLMLDCLLEVVERLPERRRAVFELCFMNELSYREASEALDISIKTVENQMAAALKELRKAFAAFRG